MEELKEEREQDKELVIADLGTQLETSKEEAVSNKAAADILNAIIAAGKATVDENGIVTLSGDSDGFGAQDQEANIIWT